MSISVLGDRGKLVLAWSLAKKELLGRYRGSVLGMGWALVTPMAMLLVYSLVFQGVFKARWAAGDSGGFAYATHLFAGLIVFTSVTEAATRATRLLQDNANLVRRVVFPLELLGLSLVIVSAVHAVLQSVVLALLLVAIGEGPRWSWLLLPVAWVWVLMLLLAVAWILCALGAYLRDLQHVVPPVMGGLLFLSPVFYPIDAAPAALRSLLQFNPLTAPIEAMRAAWFGSAIEWLSIVPSLAATSLLFIFARWLFERLRPGFADLV